LISNFLVPGVYLRHALEINGSTFLRRTMGPPIAGGLALGLACLAFGWAVPPWPVGPSALGRSLPLLANLAVGSMAYLAGYSATTVGRGDLDAIARKLLRRPAA
jgi:hypothetical protein